MREIVRPVCVALSVACLAVSMTALSNSGALAQANKQQMAPAAKPPAQAAPAPQQEQLPPIKQLALTDKQIDSALAASKEMDPITAKLSQDSKPDPKILTQLEGIAKKNGFASSDDYNNVVDNISLVLGGFDPKTKKYVGPEAVLKAQIAEVQADKKMSAKDKKDALADLNDALKSPPPAVENKGNIDLVTKNYDKLMEAFGGSDEN
ncbi:hypothetical protein UP10_00140 [Bradyrhizobium sp. LTSPM299]|uniref:hypothetical protein n=1 Tax=Bradyrhizobium sp. LTSPM299 TaxID=1619233 RepID=UPI0005C8E52F|nr:hypothetical protein [Bradyrhizobium sp. LTSPM299]KJC62808.1 hypothetical protein UP10_00140 [Bradyrhizobium sp. LTSPM299]